MTYFAHSNGQDKNEWQTLKDHLFNTRELAETICAGTTFAEFAGVAALLHDIGKYSMAFQRKLDGAKIQVDHSTAGAKEVRRLFNNTPVEGIQAMLLAYCIAGHHSGLPDHGSTVDTGDDSTLQGRLKKCIEDFSAYATEIDTTTLRLPGSIPIRPTSEKAGYSLAFFTRMVYSALVDADYLETETFATQGGKQRGGYPNIIDIQVRFRNYLEGFVRTDNAINRQRTETLKQCQTMAKEKPGLYKLTVPTGGGKTYASMAFALEHAAAYNMKRIIYVIPYTSIIEQNAATFKQGIGDEVILEHHSNFDWEAYQKRSGEESADDQTNQMSGKLRLATENWDIPVVATTNVQFFESLFANRSSRCRKVHNIANSVIIFDEAQMLPKEYLKPCLSAVYELVANYNVTAVICTATQPILERILPALSAAREICPDPDQLYEFYKRVKVINLGPLNDTTLVERIEQQTQALCIVNTRRHAKGLFEQVTEAGKYHLSTYMCPKHRKETIETIRKRLKAGSPCRVISTQIMEAGIDMDFPVGYRALAGLDSIIQAAGRVNRESRQESGNLFVFEPVTSLVKRTPTYIRQGAEVAREIFRRYEDPTCLPAIREYYERLYDLQDANAFDVKNIMRSFEKGGRGEPNFDFKTAADNFRLIENATQAVIIPYNATAERLIKEARFSQYPAGLRRKLQMYSVNIYEQEFEALNASGAIEIVGEIYSVLRKKEGYYDDATGLLIPDELSGQAIFFDGF